MTWYYRNTPVLEVPESAKSFVYCITNLINNKKYIGFKLFYFAKTKIVKGKRKRIYEISDWKSYWSSSLELQSDIQSLGESSFKREILYLAPNKAVGKYLELRTQIDLRVLEYPQLYYNGYVGGRFHKNHLKKWLLFQQDE